MKKIERQFTRSQFVTHNETGDIYVVGNFCLRQDNGEPQVVYRQVDDNAYYVRPEAEFNEMFTG